MNQHGKILVGIDFQKGSMTALRQAIRIGRWNRASVMAAHIVKPVTSVDPLDALAYMAAGVDSAMLKIADKSWKTLAATMPETEGVFFEARLDSVVGGLTHKAGTEGFSLLVLGAQEDGAGPGAGPIATGCVRRAHCDVLLVQGGHDKAYTTVVACVDFSLTSRRALSQAMRIAAQDNAKLVVVHAFTSPWKRDDFPAATKDVQEEAFRDALLARLKAFCETEPHEAQFLQPTYVLVDLDGRGYGIGAYARRIGADLVVLGKRGRTNLREIFLGTTAERILREAPCSALVVHPV